jgi:glutaminase
VGGKEKKGKDFHHDVVAWVFGYFGNLSNSATEVCFLFWTLCKLTSLKQLAVVGLLSGCRGSHRW